MSSYVEDGGDVALPVIQYWHEETIPADIAELIATFSEVNPARPHLVFSEAEAEQFIARHLGEREVEAFRACAVPAMQADYFRYCAVFALGGFYSDADARCLRPLDEMIELGAHGVLVEHPLGGSVINGTFMFREPHHPLLALVLEVATSGIEQRVGESVWAVTGPWIFTGLTGYFRFGSADALRHEVLKRGAPVDPAHLLGAIDNHAQLVELFDGVRVVPFDTAARWIGSPTGPVEHKHGDNHWVKWSERHGSIFRVRGQR